MQGTLHKVSSPQTPDVGHKNKGLNMKRQFVGYFILAILSLASPNQLYADTNSNPIINAYSNHMELRKQQRRDGDALARQQMIDNAENQTKQCEAIVNSIRLKAGLKPLEKAPDFQNNYSVLWEECIKSKIELMDATHRRQVAGTLSEAELSAAARLYPTMKTSPDGTVTELNAQELLAFMDADVGGAKQKYEALANELVELGITNEATILDSDFIKELQSAERNWALKSAIESKYMETIASEAQQSVPGYPPQSVGSPEP